MVYRSIQIFMEMVHAKYGPRALTGCSLVSIKKAPYMDNCIMFHLKQGEYYFKFDRMAKYPFYIANQCCF